MHNSEPENFKKYLTCVAHQNNSGSARGAPRKILQRGRKVIKHGTGDYYYHQ